MLLQLLKNILSLNRCSRDLKCCSEGFLQDYGRSIFHLNNQDIFQPELGLTPSCQLNLCIPQVGLDSEILLPEILKQLSQEELVFSQNK